MESKPFRYQPTCSALHCTNPARFKLAAPWSNGSSHELKNYGLACEEHKDALLARARVHRQGVTLAEGETLGTVGVYTLAANRRDVELQRLPDH